MTATTPPSNNFQQEVLERLDRIDQDTKQLNDRFVKWDARLWTLCVTLIGTGAAMSIIAAITVIATAIVIGIRVLQP